VARPILDLEYVGKETAGYIETGNEVSLFAPEKTELEPCVLPAGVT
jgi:hypothetical protein